MARGRRWAGWGAGPAGAGATGGPTRAFLGAALLGAAVVAAVLVADGHIAAAVVAAGASVYFGLRLFGGLGKGERVYSVRFVGNTAYVVTFRQVDPLYTVDLTDPAHPTILGELKIAGYSAYLHPIGEDLLLGVGQAIDETTGRPGGTQISIFDVADLRNPKLLHRAPLGPGWSEAESDHHAFLFWQKTGLVVIPFVQQAAGFRVSRAGGIVDLGRIDHPIQESRGASTTLSMKISRRAYEYW